MEIREATLDDIPAWLELARQGDQAVGGMGNLDTFYEGFEQYMTDKIQQEEAFIAEDQVNGLCLGIVAISERGNSISFLAMASGEDGLAAGGRLVEAALNALDNSRDITVNVLRSDAPVIQREKELYERFGFVEQPEEVLENGAPARVMKLAAFGDLGGA